MGYQELYDRYDAAFEEFRRIGASITERMMLGEQPAPELLEKEARAKQALAIARAQLIAARSHDGTALHFLTPSSETSK